GYCEAWLLMPVCLVRSRSSSLQFSRLLLEHLQTCLPPAYVPAFSFPEALETMMVEIAASWRCKCGIRVKVLSQVDPSQPTATRIASCSNCGDSQTVEGDKIVSVTEDISDVSPAFDSMHGSGSSISLCNEKAGLVVAHSRAFDMYLQTVSELAERAGLLAHAEFEFLYKRV